MDYTHFSEKMGGYSPPAKLLTPVQYTCMETIVEFLPNLGSKNFKIEILYYQINKISPPKVHFYGIFNNWVEIFMRFVHNDHHLPSHIIKLIMSICPCMMLQMNELCIP